MEDLRNIGRLGYSWRERMKSHVRGLRQNQTKSEEIVWKLLRNRKFRGKKFLRQHPIVYSYYKRPMYFIADFYCAEHKLVLEIDGKIHDYQVEYDAGRDFVIMQKGLKVLRIKNEELEEPEKVMEKILGAMKE
jgi:very-short-patch-repair endonuclease